MGFLRRLGPAGTTQKRSWPVTLTAEVRGGAVLLRPISLADEHRYLALQVRNADWLAPWSATTPEDPEVRMTSAGFRAGTRAMLRQARRGGSMPWLIWFAPRTSESPGGAQSEAFRLVGQLTVGPIIGGSARTTSMGYWMDEDHAGRGIMTAAASAALDHLLDVRGLHRVEIAVRPENSRSLRVVEKLGLREEGLRPRYLHIGGSWADHRVFAITAEEPRRWTSRRS